MYELCHTHLVWSFSPSQPYPTPFPNCACTHTVLKGSTIDRYSFALYTVIKEHLHFSHGTYWSCPLRTYVYSKCAQQDEQCIKGIFWISGRKCVHKVTFLAFMLSYWGEEAILEGIAFWQVTYVRRPQCIFLPRSDIHEHISLQVCYDCTHKHT